MKLPHCLTASFLQPLVVMHCCFLINSKAMKFCVKPDYNNVVVFVPFVTELQRWQCIVFLAVSQQQVHTLSCFTETK
jgi:hypothetical protein